MKQNPHPGRFVVFEGLDGSGQTTQAKLLAKWISDCSEIAYYTKEPSDGPFGSILKLLLAKRLVFTNGKSEPGLHDEVTMALAFAADRADHLRNDVVPKLKKGIYVVGDRYYLSSLAYQSVAADYEWIRELNRNSVRPDLTIFLDVSVEKCVARMRAQRWHVELYEEVDSLRSVRENYLTAISRLREQGEQVEIVDGSLEIKDVHAAVVASLKANLKTGNPHANGKLSDAVPLSEREIAALVEG